jgi:hypothetical protein
MIVTVLRGGVAPIVIVMIVTPRLIAAIVMPLLLVLMLRGSLILVLLLAVLGADSQWQESANGQRRHSKNHRLP